MPHYAQVYLYTLLSVSEAFLAGVAKQCRFGKECPSCTSAEGKVPGRTAQCHSVLYGWLWKQLSKWHQDELSVSLVCSWSLCGTQKWEIIWKWSISSVLNRGSNRGHLNVQIRYDKINAEEPRKCINIQFCAAHSLACFIQSFYFQFISGLCCNAPSILHYTLKGSCSLWAWLLKHVHPLCPLTFIHIPAKSKAFLSSSLLAVKPKTRDSGGKTCFLLFKNRKLKDCYLKVSSLKEPTVIKTTQSCRKQVRLRGEGEPQASL